MAKYNIQSNSIATMLMPRSKAKIATIVSGLLFSISNGAMACELCKENQPKVLRSVSHGAGPQGDIDYIIIWTAAVLVGIALFFSLKYLIKPNEDGKSHVKNIVIENI